MAGREGGQRSKLPAISYSQQKKVKTANPLISLDIKNPTCATDQLPAPCTIHPLPVILSMIAVVAIIKPLNQPENVLVLLIHQ